MSEHPSPFELEAHHAGDSAPGVADHVEACDACRSVLDELDAARVALHGRRAPADFARDIRAVVEEREAARRPRWGWFLAPALAAAAAVALFVAWPGPPVDPGGDGVRLKGPPALGVLIERSGGSQVEVFDDTTLEDGDRVRVVLDLPSRAPVTVGILDASGEWTVLVTGTELAAGRHRLEDTFRVRPGEPLDVTILAGDPDAVEGARAGMSESGAPVARLRLRTDQ